MKNRKREICTSGTVRAEDSNVLIYSANLRGDDGNVGIIRSPLRAIVLPDPLRQVQFVLLEGNHRSATTTTAPVRRAL
jgi:hypothetical protein